LLIRRLFLNQENNHGTEETPEDQFEAGDTPILFRSRLKTELSNRWRTLLCTLV